MNDLPTTNQTAEQQPPPRKRGKQVLLWFGFLGLMVVFFFAGYYLSGAYRSAATPATPARVDISDNTEWQQLPPPKKKVVTANVEVSEIIPDPKPQPAAQPAAPSESAPHDDRPTSQAEERVNPVDIRPEPTPSAPPAPKPTSPPPPPADTKKYVVQIGVYAEKTNAEIIAANLADHGYASSIRHINRNGTAHYQVVVGNPKDRAGADALANELRKSGREVAISPVD